MVDYGRLQSSESWLYQNLLTVAIDKSHDLMITFTHHHYVHTVSQINTHNVQTPLINHLLKSVFPCRSCCSLNAILCLFCKNNVYIIIYLRNSLQNCLPHFVTHLCIISIIISHQTTQCGNLLLYYIIFNFILYMNYRN